MDKPDFSGWAQVGGSQQSYSKFRPKDTPPAIIFLMTPLELFQEARLTEAILVQQQIVKARPDDVVERFLLCDFLAFARDMAGIQHHLKVLRDAPEDIREYLDQWEGILLAEEARHQGEYPDFLIDQPEHAHKRAQARDRLSSGQVEFALDALDEADELAPWLEGHVDGREFEGWRDSDDLLGPILEVFYVDRYVWFSTEQIRKLRLEDANSLRDTLYRPATLWLIGGSESGWDVLVPTLYVGSSNHPDEGIRMGAGVDWIEVEGVMRGVGERTFLFGEEELGISEFKQVEVRRR